ncbi:phenylacetic acid degradation protein PaaN [Paremcibacter congregatus]|uniref:Phenylacetic acid degradation protein PaaN n=1 Tax=Paremcibacter congregatus TaxID=2043170 RepID=A0A2G4YU54_9PROT|nr:phenylacetic acid degradation protein PaaN [Paremcibacter congregatus]PHZ85823.1 phenylacetic acid degradation protein PaaN [Paremcibacter congregatus]QDE26786.1 phenylacetic acid degradation protein PaaN [Paremcibacter congregatus]
MSHSALFDRHKDTLDQAIKASRTREYWTAYPEMPSPKVYGETASKDGEAAFKSYLNKAFDVDQPGAIGTVGAEKSPYGFDLGVTYPKVDVNALVSEVEALRGDWAKASIEARTGVCLEILHRINRRSFEMAFAVMHTTGQAFMMAFQAGGPHAQDRGLEAVAYAYEDMARTPAVARWEKPQGKRDPIVMEKHFTVVPRGIGLVIGCSTFPTWNSYPGLFASLVTGNAVIVKPHPGAILPLAITVAICRDVLKEEGFNPNLVTLAADSAEAPLAKDLALRPEVKLIDFTGSTTFGDWLEDNARQAQVYTEKAGVNCVIIDSTDNFRGLVSNLAFTLSLYSGQMCTTPQNIFIPEGGIETEDGHKSFDEVAAALATGVEKLNGDDERACAILGAIQSEATLERLESYGKGDNVVLASHAVPMAGFDQATIRTPLILKATDESSYSSELFGPISYVVPTKNTADSLGIVEDSVKNNGAISFGIYSTSEEVLNQAEEVACNSGVAVSFNLTGGVYVNQTAAFSDFHATGCNPAANAALSDTAYVSNRYRVVQSRKHV